MIGSRRNLKHYLAIESFINMIRRGKTAIVFAPDYVILDRKSYDSMFHQRPQAFESHEIDYNWIRDRFLKE